MTNPFMERAIELAVQNVRSGRGGPFGAVVVRDRRIVAEGTNVVTSVNDPTAHAEIVAIRAACSALKTFRLDDCEIFSTCEPCPMCLGAIYWARLQAVSFGGTAADASAAGFDDAFIYKQIAAPIAERSIPFRQIMRDETLGAFREWAQKPDRVRY
ncbi:MAG TPA: nucleoside deaminase [Bryobacteraceae bacterium]|jgi:guanine deaminase|nr:nucleoside deaminase [Bryobacteraceae bacterium]